jgi:uncharacterized protein with PIN domain
MMLGKLARWMRVLGYDVLYLNPVTDGELIQISQQEQRVLLTRDTRLVQRRGVGEYLLLTKNAPMEQLAEVLDVYPPPPGKAFSRCILCNASLISVSKREVKDEVPEYVYLNESKFGRCESCGRIYWQGTHYRRMVRTWPGLSLEP